MDVLDCLINLMYVKDVKLNMKMSSRYHPEVHFQKHKEFTKIYLMDLIEQQTILRDSILNYFKGYCKLIIIKFEVFFKIYSVMTDKMNNSILIKSN